MEALFAIAFGVIISIAVYLLMSRNVLRIVVGLLVFSNGINLAMFLVGRIGRAVPPLVPEGEVIVTATANPVPQALILTAIVISFALLAYAVVLFDHTHRSLETLDTDAMRVAEPPSGAHGEKDST